MNSRNPKHKIFDNSSSIEEEIDFFINESNKLTFQTPATNASLCINSGLSGYILFLIKLFEETKDPIYLESIVEKAMIVVANVEKVEGNNYSFYYGKMGVAYTLSKVYEVTSDEFYLREALEIARNCSCFLNSPFINNSLYGGRSGIVIVLLQLYKLRKEKWLLERLESFLEKILLGLYLGSTGLRAESWDYTNNIQTFCSFSSGNAGVAYMLLEVGKYFQNPTFYKASELLLMYIKNCWDPAMENWPDFRKKTATAQDYETHKEEFLNNNEDFFINPSDNTSFNDGTAGIGMVYLKAYEILGNETYRTEAEKAILKIISKTENLFPSNSPLKYKEIASYWSFAKEVDILLGNQDFTQWLLTVSDELIANYKKGLQVEEVDLMFLNRKTYSKIPFMFFDPSCSFIPEVYGNHIEGSWEPGFDTLTMGEPEMKSLFIKTIFPYSVFLLEKFHPEILNEYLKKEPLYEIIKVKTEFANFVLSRVKTPMIAEAFAFEETKLQMKDKIRSNALSGMENSLLQEKIEKIFTLDDSLFDDQKLIIAPNVKIIETQYDWTVLHLLIKSGNENVQNEFDDFCKGGSYFILLQPKSKFFVHELCLDQDYYILNCFISPASIKIARENLLNFCKGQDESFFASFMESAITLNEAFFVALEEKILKRICALLSMGILIPA